MRPYLAKRFRILNRPNLTTYNDFEVNRFLQAKFWSFAGILCTSLALLGTCITGFVNEIHIPVAMLFVGSVISFAQINEQYFETPARVLHVSVVVLLFTLSFFVQSVTTLVFFIPVILHLLFSERNIVWRNGLFGVLGLAFIIIVYRCIGSLYEVGTSAALVRIAYVDGFLGALFTGLVLKKHVDYLRQARASVAEIKRSLDVETARKQELVLLAQRTQEELKNINADLASAIAKNKLRKAKIEATRDQMRQFTYAASHDLKEPIRTIKSFLQMIRRKLYQRSNGQVVSEAQKQLVEDFNFVDRSASAMHTVLERLLEYSRLEKIKPEPKEVCLRELWLRSKLASGDTTAAIELKELTASGAKHDLISDPRLIQITFNELLSNALKFSNGSPVSFAFAVKKNNVIEIQITDSGIGIDQAYRSKAFQLLQRLNQRHEFEGAGVGLSMVKRMVAKIGGEVWLSGESGVGTTAHVKLPLTIVN